MLNILLVDLGTPRDEFSEALGIETLASYIKEEFSETVFLMLKSLELDDCLDISGYIQDKPYSIIGLSTKIRSYDRFQKSMEIIRKKAPKSLVLIGDILGTYTFESVLSIYPNVICVRGEGEVAFKELIALVLKLARVDNLPLGNIPNLAYLLNGQLQLTKRETFDLTQAKHPDRALAREVLLQSGIARVEASRGCAYSMCEFCGVIEKYSGPGWRGFSIDFIIKELEVLSKIGFKSPYFTDEDFWGTKIDRIYRFADKLEEAKKDGRIRPDLDFYINLRANSILGIGIGGKEESCKLLKRLKEVGLREVFTGIESGCKDQLMNRYKKGVTKEKNIEAIQILRNLGIEVDLGFIFFDRESILSELRENINFIYEANIFHQDSQLIKKIRIEPRTPLGIKFLEQHPNVQIDLNLVEFPYQFKYRETGMIYDIFVDWQKDDLDVIYNLQSFCRGEIPHGYTRKEIKEIISQYRELDVRYLDTVIQIFERDVQNKDQKIKDITLEFKEARQGLDKTLIHRILWLNSTFRRFKK